MKVQLLVSFALIFYTSATYFTDIRNCKITTSGQEYIGNISTTETGKSCIQWEKELLEELQLQERDYSEEELELLGNYCRNPTNFPNGPWCFVDEETLEWEYCNIPSCYKNRNWCKDSHSGIKYIGPINVAKSGKPCQPWNKQQLFNASCFPENNVKEAGDKCRNPDGIESGPWCYINKDMTIRESCPVEKCHLGLNQFEYFDGFNFLSADMNNVTTLFLDKLYESVNVFVSIKPDLWTPEIRKETFLWATDYNVRCQKDFDEFEFCQHTKTKTVNDKMEIMFQCSRPARSLIFISPLGKAKFRIRYEGVKVYELNRKSSDEFISYKTKIEGLLNERSRQDIIIPTTKNYGAFYLLQDNVVPYAVNMKKKVVFTISQIGKGRIGFMASEIYISDEYKSNLKDFFTSVYGKDFLPPVQLTSDEILDLIAQKKTGEALSKNFLWNAHDLIDSTEMKPLLDLINIGLKIIIGIKPWAYEHYRKRILESDLRPIFLAAGIWPSLNSYSENITVLNQVEVETFPLVHLLDYAKTNLTNLISMSDFITNALLSVPLDILLETRQSEVIRKTMEDLFSLYLPYAKFSIPCLKYAISDNFTKSLIGMLNTFLLQPLGNKFIAPGISFYPGKIQVSNSKIVNVKMILNLRFDDEAAQLGLYLLPGHEISVRIAKSKSQTCQLHINYHLFNVRNNEMWEKWPVTSASFTLRQGIHTTISNPFGGILSITCKEGNDRVEISFTGVIQIPMFDRRDAEISKTWNKFQQLSSPWAIIASDTVVFVVASSTIRNMARPGPILELYDYMIKEQFHLRGLSVADQKRELVSVDIQIIAGYMHAGYPIGTKMFYVSNPLLNASFLFDEKKIKEKGEWGLLHEIGHNLQDKLFTFSGTTEITNNIFTLVAMEAMTNSSPWTPNVGWLNDEDLIQSFITHINGGTFSDWKASPFLGLGIYAQLQNSFGWEFYAQIFRRYNSLKMEIKTISEDEKVQLWIKETSMLVSMNLCPLYDLWKWPVDEEINKQLSNLTYFLPNDFLMDKVEIMVNDTIVKWGGFDMISREPSKIPIIVGTLKDKLRIEGSKVIESINIFE